MNSTVIIHIYNEEYLLPFWLNHHKNIFNHGIIIDYRSTDKSIEICKQICPTWNIITSRNLYFTAIDVDQEIMEIEEKLNGIKIALNVTEFIFCKKSLTNIFKNIDKDMWLEINFISPQAIDEKYPQNINELFLSLLNENVLFNDCRVRYIHNSINGKYSPGRHEVQTDNKLKTTDIQGLWLGYFPLNNHMLNRKLQIQKNIPVEETARQFGLHHKRSVIEILNDNYKLYNKSKLLNKINPDLYKILNNSLNNLNLYNQMHDTALYSGKYFAELYGKKNYTVLDIGGKDVNGTLRQFFESLDMLYICIDMEEDRSVDIVVKPNEKLPFETGSVDLVVSSSCFEHDPCFWMTFKEICRVIKKDGYIYMSAPSDGPYHKHPGDNWRFYGDAGQALAYWSGLQISNEEVYPVKVEETFFILPKNDIWRDFVCIWKRIDEKQTDIVLTDKLKFDNGKLRQKLMSEGYQCAYMI